MDSSVVERKGTLPHSITFRYEGSLRHWVSKTLVIVSPTYIENYTSAPKVYL
jgi:hypothetical protein